MEPMTVPIGADDKPKFNYDNYDNWRRIDLEYAIVWNRLKGRDVPKDTKLGNVDKKKLINFCEYHNVDMRVCETTVDRFGQIRIKRPPRDKDPVAEAPVEETSVSETKPKTEMAELREKAKALGINSFGVSKEKLKELLSEQDAT